jgi:O-acetyl-ADP-ribose deacetylase (regulator of RNase III)
MTDANASYWAMRAELREVTRIPDLLHTLYCPGLATGVGAVPPQEAADAMAEAYRDWLGAAG